MVKLSDIELPQIFKNKLLFSSGFHNDLNVAPEEIMKSFELTDWNDQRNRSLFLSHSDRDAEAWLGRIINPYMKNGDLFGDLEIFDANMAMKIGPGKAPIGVSAEIRWPPQYSDPVDFTYRGFAMVPNPEVPDTMINFSKKTKDGYNTAQIMVITKDVSENKADFSDGIVTSETAKGSPIVEENKTEEKEEEAKADFSKEKEDSNLMSTERGFNEEKMENTEKIVEEVKEEVVETKETTEEVKEETTEVEETKEEDAKADFSTINDKLDVLSERMTKMEANYAKFSEAEEAKEEVVEEKVEAAPAEEAEAKVEEVKEDVKEVVEEKEKVEEVAEVTEDTKADFSALASKLDKLADAIAAKDVAPMSTAEFGTKGLDKANDVIDRLTESLSN